MTSQPITRDEVFKATPDELFDAFTVQEQVTQWFAQHADIDAHTGGWWTFNWPPHMAARGRYLTVDRPNHLVWTWEASIQDTRVAPGAGEIESSVILDYTFTALDNGQTHIHIEESGHGTEEIARMNATGIDLMLTTLRQFLEEGKSVDWTTAPPPGDA